MFHATSLAHPSSRLWGRIHLDTGCKTVLLQCRVEIAKKSGKYFRDDAAVNVGQTVVASRVSIGEPFVVKTHQPQDRGVKVVDVDRILHGLKSKLVRFAVSHSTFHARACHPDCETPVVVISSIDFALIGSFLG